MPAPTQAHRKCAFSECISISVPRLAFVNDPTRTGMNRNPNAQKAAVSRLATSSDTLKTQVEIIRANLPPRMIPPHILAKNARIPTPRATSPSNIMTKGMRMNGAVPTQGNHFDFSIFLKNSINIMTPYHRPQNIHRRHSRSRSESQLCPAQPSSSLSCRAFRSGAPVKSCCVTNAQNTLILRI